MGYCVISFVDVNLNKGEFREQDVADIVVMLDGEVGQLNSGKDWINFQLDGNKGVCYDKVNELKELLLRRGYSFNISGMEFIEGDIGYYFDSEEEMIPNGSN